MDRSGKEIFRAVGLMSGTSMDGIDAAIIETDGMEYIRTGEFISKSYSAPFRERLRQMVGTRGQTTSAGEIESELVVLHSGVVADLLNRASISGSEVDLVGFHGHTVHHEPTEGLTRQIGDGAMLAALTGIRVVNDFRSADVAAGGQGAPLVPLFHRAMALAHGLDTPLAVLNIGGVANVTWIGEGDPVAFDTGPGMALIDDLFFASTGTPWDPNGETALGGTVDEAALATLLSHPYFALPVPKSLDRNAFDASPVKDLSLADAAATLAAFTAGAVGKALALLPAAPKRWLVSGGGRHNRAVMAALARVLGTPVDPVEAVGWDGDAVEAQAFAYLAVRSLKNLPLTLPTTTGVPHPLTGGRLHEV